MPARVDSSFRRPMGSPTLPRRQFVAMQSAEEATFHGLVDQYSQWQMISDARLIRQQEITQPFLSTSVWTINPSRGPHGLWT